MRAAILANDKATSAAFAKAGQEVSAQLTPQSLNSALMNMLDGAKKSILQTPEQQAAEERANKTGFTVGQLKEIEFERCKLAAFKPEEVQQPTVQQFHQEVQKAAAQGRTGR